MLPNTYYHIFNRANGFERLFVSEENYAFFLRRYRHFVEPFVDTYCFCLMPNHFHFLIRTKDADTIIGVLEIWRKEDPEGFLQRFPKFQTLEISKNPEGIEKFQTLEILKTREGLERFLSKQWSNLFSSYTLAYNKQQGRRGSLFMKNFKRKEISDETYLKNLILYIHNNPVEAQLVNAPVDWGFSSFKQFIQASLSPTHQEVVDWFNDRENFIACHWLKSA
jgi:putative transposase